MEKLFISVILIMVILVYELVKTKRENKILYNNYKTAMKVLAEYDPKLKAYLESKER